MRRRQTLLMELLVGICLVSILISGSAYSGEAVSPKTQGEPQYVTRLRKEGVRLAHLTCMPESIEGMAKIGCNTIMLNTYALQMFKDLKKTTPPDSDEIIRESDLYRTKVILKNTADACKKSNVVCVAAIDGLAEDAAIILSKHKYRFFVDADGNKGTITPCPLERRYWFGFMLPQFLTQARALRASDTPGGAIFDLEFYAGGDIYPFWFSKDICYCDTCWTDFCRESTKRKSKVNLPEKERGAWVRKQGLTDDYHKVMESRLCSLMKEFAGECRSVCPDFMLGFYPYVPNWMSNAILRGWSTPEIPALAMSESEFYQGFYYYSEERLSSLRKTGINALYVGAVFQGSCYPEHYASMLDELCRRADGYWLYYSAMFFNPVAAQRLKPPDEGTQYTLSALPDEYFRELTRANAAVDKGRSLPARFPHKFDLMPLLKKVDTDTAKEPKTVVWETPAVEIQPQVNLGGLCWQSDLDAKKLTISVHDASTGEKLLYGGKSGMQLSRLSFMTHRKFIFRIAYEGVMDDSSGLVKKFWLDASKAL